MKTNKTEILIIGSGFGAAAPAMLLSQAGFQVTMLEKGPMISPRRDLKQTQDPTYLGKYLKSLPGNNINFTYAEGYGGGSTFYEMVSLRAPSLVFNQQDNTGARLWPSGLTRTLMDPYYERAEKMLNIHQIKKEEIPKTGVVFSNLMRNLGYSCDRARYAVKGCAGSAYCVSGCILGAKQSLHVNYLPAAEKAGMKLFTNYEVSSIHPIHSKLETSKMERNMYNIPYRYMVKAVALGTDQPVSFKAKVVILGAGTVGTAKILLNSIPHLPKLSNQLGRNIAFNGSVKVLGLLPEGSIEGDMLTGMSHPSMISYHFLKKRGITIAAAKALPLVLTSSAKLSLNNGRGRTNTWGRDHVELMKKYRRRMIILYALGLTAGNAEIKLSRNSKFQAHLAMNDSLRDYYENTKKLLESILQRNDVQVINAEMINRSGQSYKDVYFGTSHMTGSCKMADNKSRGVINHNGEVFDYAGLMVTDGAAIPGSLAVNTSLTILANAERISDSLLRFYKR